MSTRLSWYNGRLEYTTKSPAGNVAHGVRQGYTPVRAQVELNALKAQGLVIVSATYYPAEISMQPE